MLNDFVTHYLSGSFTNKEGTKRSNWPSLVNDKKQCDEIAKKVINELQLIQTIMKNDSFQAHIANNSLASSDDEEDLDPATEMKLKAQKANENNLSNQNDDDETLTEEPLTKATPLPKDEAKNLVSILSNAIAKLSRLANNHPPTFNELLSNTIFETKTAVKTLSSHFPEYGICV